MRHSTNICNRRQDFVLTKNFTGEDCMESNDDFKCKDPYIKYFLQEQPTDGIGYSISSIFPSISKRIGGCYVLFLNAILRILFLEYDV